MAIAAVLESSELLELFRFKSESEMLHMFKDTKKAGEINEEVADVLFSILRLAQMYDNMLKPALSSGGYHTIRYTYP